MTEVLGRLDGARIRLVVYDQLNPAYARYYSREEVTDLFQHAGYFPVRLYHRHRYSWAVQAVNSEPRPTTTSFPGSDFERSRE